MSEVLQVVQLVPPLRDDAQCILQEGHHDQKAADGGQIPASG
jgi:hypothetical protein